MRDSLNQNSSYKNLKSARTTRPAHMIKRQAGMSFIGVFALIAMLMFVGLFAFKVVPGYVEYMTVTKIAEDTQANAELMRAPKSKVMSSINAAYRQNNLWDLKSEDTITLTKDGRTGYKLMVDYEKRSNLFSNIYVVTSFQKEVGQP